MPALGLRRRPASTLIKLAVTLALYAFIFYRLDTGRVLEHLASVDAVYLAASVLVYSVGQLSSAYRWFLMLHPVRLYAPFLRLAGFYFIGMFFNFFLPTAVGGDAVKAVLLSRETGSPARATVSVFMERNVGLAALLTTALVASWLAPPVRLLGLSLPAIAMGLFAAFVALNLLIFNRRAYSLVDRIASVTPLARAWPGTSALYAALTPYLRAPRTLLATLALSFLFQAIVITVVFLNARALRLTFPVSVLAVFVPLISLGAMLPLSINGLGVRDALYLLLFARLGTPPDAAVSLALLYLAVTIVSSLPGGLIYLLQNRSVQGELQA